MSTFNNIKIQTPGGNLYTGSNTPATSTNATLITGSNSTSGCETCLDSIIINNLGSGNPIYKGKGNYNVFNLRSIVAGEGASITHDLETITISVDTSGMIIPSGPTSLSQLTDVTITESALVKGQVLTWSGTTWDAETPQGGGSSDVQNLSDLKDVNVPSPTVGQVLTWSGSKWDAETPQSSSGGFVPPTGTRGTVVFPLTVVMKAGTPGATSVTGVPDGWTITVTDPSTEQYNITVKHTTGMIPFGIFAAAPDVFDTSMRNLFTIGLTEGQTTAYLSYHPADTTSFTINSCSASNMRTSPSTTEDLTVILHILMG